MGTEKDVPSHVNAGRGPIFKVGSKGAATALNSSVSLEESREARPGSRTGTLYLILSGFQKGRERKGRGKREIKGALSRLEVWDVGTSRAPARNSFLLHLSGRNQVVRGKATW